MELSAEDMEKRARVFTSLKARDMNGALEVLKTKYADVRLDGEYIKIIGSDKVEETVEFLLQKGHKICEIKKNKVGLEEYYVELMSKKDGE